MDAAVAEDLDAALQLGDEDQQSAAVARLVHAARDKGLQCTPLYGLLRMGQRDQQAMQRNPTEQRPHRKGHQRLRKQDPVKRQPRGYPQGDPGRQAIVHRPVASARGRRSDRCAAPPSPPLAAYGARHAIASSSVWCHASKVGPWLPPPRGAAAAETTPTGEATPTPEATAAKATPPKTTPPITAQSAEATAQAAPASSALSPTRR